MSTLFHELRMLPRAFWVLVGATFVNRFGVFVWPFLTLYLTREGYSASEASWAVAAYSAGSFCAALLGGWLADRLGRNVTMALSALTGAACMLGLSQAHDLLWLTLLALITGLVTDAGAPAGSALLQDIVPPRQRVVAYAVQRFAVNLGWSFGPAVAGWLAQSSFFWLFAVDAVTSAFFGVIAWKFLPRGERTAAHQAGWAPAWQSIRANRPFLILALSCVLMSWVFRQTSSTFALHFEYNGLPSHWTGTVLALNGVMICLLEVPLASATRTWPVRLMLSLGYLLMGGGYVLLMGRPGLPSFFAMMIVFTIGEMFAFSRQQAYAAGLAPDDMRGRYAGFLSLGWGLGGIVSSIAALHLYDVSPDLVWGITAALGLTAAGMILRK
jgi:MFS family permease